MAAGISLATLVLKLKAMETTELIKDLKESLDAIKEGTSPATIGELVRTSVRSLHRLNTDKSELNLHLTKIAVDLTSLHANQLQYWELRSKSENPGLKVKPEFDGSFFESLKILKIELFEALKKL